VKHARGQLLFAAAALVVVMASGCGPSNQGRPSHAAPTVTLSVPGHPSARVTDVRAYALTDQQASSIERACIQGAGIPGAEDECAAVLRSSIKAAKATTCPGPHARCLFTGDVDVQVEGKKVAVMELTIPPSDQTTCPKHGVVSCGGGAVVVSEATVNQLPDPVPAAVTSSTGSPSSSASVGPEPSPSYSPAPASPAPTAPSEVAPVSPVETGAGASP
jgi:hypothetical protein